MATAESTVLLNKVRKKIEELNNQLFIAQAGVGVAARALKAQDAENDWDIACVLEDLVGTRIQEQLQTTDVLLSELGPRPDAESEISVLERASRQ